MSVVLVGDVWENIFAICIANYGVVLFVFVIGKMQSHLEKVGEIRRKWREAENLEPYHRLPSYLRNKLDEHKRYNWRKRDSVHVEDLLSDLPHELMNDIKYRICLELLQKVDELRNWDRISLVRLCECLQPVFFSKRSRIIREGEPIDEMLFVVQGQLWMYTSCKGITTASPSTDHSINEKDYLKDGDHCGEQLIAWAQNEPSSSNLPTSKRTIQALADVEGFVLMANDLKNAFIKHKELVSNNQSNVGEGTSEAPTPSQQQS